MMDAFHGALSPEEQADLAFAYRVYFMPKVAGRASASDEAVEFLKPDSAKGLAVSRVLIKGVDKTRFSSTQVVHMMRDQGFPNFNMHHHTTLAAQLKARDPKQGFAKPGLQRGSWEWFEPWVERVRAHCEENAARYA